MNISFENLISGYKPLTSLPFEFPEALPGLEVEKGVPYVITLSPYFKRGNRSIYVNLFSAHESKGMKKNDLMTEAGAAIKIIAGRNVGGIIVTPVRCGNSSEEELLKIIEYVKDGVIATSDGTRLRVKDITFDTLISYTEPPQLRHYLNTLPAPTYRGLAMRWTGKSAASAPRKITECVDAICDQNCAPGVEYHPGFDRTWIHTSSPFSLPRSSPLPVLPLVTHHPNGAVSKATTPATAKAMGIGSTTAPAQPATSVTPAPGSTASIAEQIEALSERAAQADVLASRVDELIEEVNTLKNRPQVVINTTPKFTASGNVDIAGTELPHFDLSPVGEWTVPEIAPAYDLTGWGARFECGDLEHDFTLGHVMKAILTGTPTRLIGPPATGKTSGIVQACAHMGIPCRVIQCGKGLTEYTLLGEQTIEAGSVVWKDGILPSLGRTVADDGPSVIVFDEIDHLTAPIQSLLHGVLEGRTLDLPNGEKVSIPENVVCVATANTYGTGDVTGRHAAAAVSDDAFISRWTRTFTVRYLSEDRERELLSAHGIPAERLDGLMTFVKATRSQALEIDNGTLSDGVRTPVTLRTLLPLAAECSSGGDFVPAFLSTVMGQFSPDEMGHARELVRTCMSV